MNLATLARTLLDLHHTGRTLVLPNVWDAWSARAVATGGSQRSVSAATRWRTPGDKAITRT